MSKSNPLILFLVGTVPFLVSWSDDTGRVNIGTKNTIMLRLELYLSLLPTTLPTNNDLNRTINLSMNQINQSIGLYRNQIPFFTLSWRCIVLSVMIRRYWKSQYWNTQTLYGASLVTVVSLPTNNDLNRPINQSIKSTNSLQFISKSRPLLLMGGCLILYSVVISQFIGWFRNQILFLLVDVEIKSSFHWLMSKSTPFFICWCRNQILFSLVDVEIKSYFHWLMSKSNPTFLAGGVSFLVSWSDDTGRVITGKANTRTHNTHYGAFFLYLRGTSSIIRGVHVNMLQEQTLFTFNTVWCIQMGTDFAEMSCWTFSTWHTGTKTVF